MEESRNIFCFVDRAQIIETEFKIELFPSKRSMHDGQVFSPTLQRDKIIRMLTGTCYRSFSTRRSFQNVAQFAQIFGKMVFPFIRKVRRICMNLFEEWIRCACVDRSDKSNVSRRNPVRRLSMILRRLVCSLLLIFSDIEVSLSYCSQHCHLRSSSSRRTKSLLESLYRVKYTPLLKSDRRHA